METDRRAPRAPAETAIMQSDPSIGTYRTAMARIEELMPLDPENGISEGDELHALVDLVEVYERRWFPEFSRQT